MGCTYDKRPGLTRDLPAGKEERCGWRIRRPLIYGERDAVLVDTFLTTEQSQTLLDWVCRERQEPHRNLCHHGHGDHFFGLASLLERFPRAKAVATPEIVKAMREHLSPAWIDKFWRRLFPGEIPDRLLVAEPLADNELELEGHKLVAVMPGGPYGPLNGVCTSVDRADRGGDASTTAFILISARRTPQSRLEWISTLDKLEALKPKAWSPAQGAG